MAITTGAIAAAVATAFGKQIGSVLGSALLKKLAGHEEEKPLKIEDIKKVVTDSLDDKLSNAQYASKSFANGFTEVIFADNSLKH